MKHKSLEKFDDEVIVVTGGAGFIGSCVIQALNEMHITNIVVVDNLGTTEKWKNLVGKYFVDALHKNDFFTWLQGRQKQVKAFIHLGACSSTTESDANYLLENNYRYTLRLAEYALTHGIRFIYASSAATYGGGEKGFSDNHEGLEELNPLNMYGYSKHLFDLWALRQGVLESVVGLKYFNVYGPNEYHKGRMCSALVRMVPQVLQEGYVLLFASDRPDEYADGEQKRDFIYVKDVAKMTCAFLKNEACGIYNIGTGEAISWNRLAKAVFSALNKPQDIRYIEMPSDLKGKYQYYTRAEIEKAQKILTDTSPMPFEDAIKDYVTKHLIHNNARW